MELQLKPYFAFCSEYHDVLRKLFDATAGLTDAGLRTAIASASRGAPNDVDAVRQRMQDWRLIEQRAGDEDRWQMTAANRQHLAHVLHLDELQTPEVMVAMAVELRRRITLVIEDCHSGRERDAIIEMHAIERRVDEMRESVRRLHSAITVEAHRLRVGDVQADRRFALICDLWDHFIDPLYQHVSQNGGIESVLVSVEADLTALIEGLPNAGEQAEEAHHLRACVGRARREALRRFTDAHAEVMPLYKEHRQRQRVTKGVEILVERLCRHGVVSLDLGKTLPIAAFRFNHLIDPARAMGVVDDVLTHRQNPPQPIMPPVMPVASTARRRIDPGSLSDMVPTGDLMASAIAAGGGDIGDTLSIYGHFLQSRGLRRHFNGQRGYDAGNDTLEAPVVSVERI